MQLMSIRTLSRKPECPLAEGALRKLVSEGRVPSLKIGKKSYLDADTALRAIGRMVEGVMS